MGKKQHRTDPGSLRDLPRSVANKAKLGNSVDPGQSAVMNVPACYRDLPRAANSYIPVKSASSLKTCLGLAAVYKPAQDRQQPRDLHRSANSYMI